MKIYLAGKISRNDWRHSIVDGLGEVSVHPYEWPVLKESIFATHDYVGPYFLSLGHGQSHCSDYLHATDCQHGATHEISEACFDAINQCDIVFAYIESRECFGTFCEIGYAIAKKKQIAIFYAPGVDDDNDMWFQNCNTWVGEKNVTDPEEELRKICPQKLPRNLEKRYESEDPFYNPAQLDWRQMPDGKEKRNLYYCSPEWEALRLQVIQRNGGVCEMCYAELIYAVHHLTYARLYKEDPTDLQGLCERCHQSTHFSRNRSNGKSY
jgi:hypothetical protein